MVSTSPAQSHINISKCILTEILSLAKNYIDRDISLAINDIDRDIPLAKNDIDREGQQQDKKNFKYVFTHKTSLCFCRDTLSFV